MSRPIKTARSRIRKNKLDFSTAPPLNDEESNLLAAAFLSTPEFKANGTFPQIDLAKLAQTANYSTKASANTAWWELRRKLKALPQVLKVSSGVNKSPAKAAAVADQGVDDEIDQGVDDEIDQGVDDEGDQGDQPESDSKSPEPTVSEVIPNRTRRRMMPTPIEPKKPKTKAAEARKEYPPGASTYARHYQGTDMAFALRGRLNIIYDNKEEQDALFEEDFGGMDFD